MDMLPRTPYPPPLSPIIKRKLVSPENKRIRDIDKVPNPWKLSKKNSVMTCRICKEKGHNIRTYKSVLRSQKKATDNNKASSSNAKGKRKISNKRNNPRPTKRNETTPVSF